MNIILLGAPGAGKGTQAATLVEKTKLVHVSSGDLFRAALRDGTPLGLKAKEYMDRGDLVPDEIVIGMILERISQPDCQHGVIFDGFPRTAEQARALEQSLAEQQRSIDAVIYIAVPREVLIQRIAGRRTCRECGAVFNIYSHPPQQDGICDVCGGTLYQRQDDTVETAQNRLDVYFRQTMPLIAYYREKGILHEVDGQQEIHAVTEAMMAAIA